MKKFRQSIYDQEHTFLRDWLIKKRKVANLTQRQLAEKLKSVHSLVGKIEKGERRLDLIEFLSYCDALNVSTEEMFKLIIELQSINSPKIK